MNRNKPSDFPQKPLDLVREYRHGHIDRRSFLDSARRFAVSGLTAGAVFEMMRPNHAWAQAGEETHPASARVVDRLRTDFTFQISVDVGTIEQGLRVASAALKGGVDIVEMGTPLLKNAGVSNVVPAFRKQFPEALLLAEDDEHVLAIIASTLDSLGYNVMLAEDGTTVLEMSAHHGEDIRLLILDVDLPEKGGPDCIKTLRERGLNTPAIMITGNPGFDSTKLDDKTVLLRKPFGMPELASTVSEVLGRDPGQEARS